MIANQRVRLIANPGRIGYSTGKSISRAGKQLWQIRFPDGTQYFPEDQLEVIEFERQHPLDLLESGRIGRASDLRRLLTHIKLSGKLANLLYSMEVTNTDFYAYQFKPVIKLLNSINNGLLIADEVGLGKTIEAGLIWTEMQSRFDYRRLMVLCPAFLREKWRRELSNRFGIDAQILDAKGIYEKLKLTINEGPLSSFAIIGSMQGLRPRKDWEQNDSKDKRPSSLLASLLANQKHENTLIDLLIIDEAHYLRLSNLKNTDKKTAILGRLLRDVSEYVVLLSATPIHLRSQDLYQLLNIVDEATFNQPKIFDDILNANAPLIKMRDAVIRNKLTTAELKQMLLNALNNPLLKGNRQLSSLIDSPPKDEELRDPRFRSELAYRLDTINLLGHVISRTRKRDVTEWRVIREAIPEKIALTNPEKEFYNAVTRTVREFCSKHKQHEGFILTMPQRQMSSSMPAALREWKRKSLFFAEQLYEDYGTNISPDDIKSGPVISALINKVEKFGDLEELWNNDSKYIRLLSKVQQFLKNFPSEKIVLFSYFRATLDYLHERLSSDGISSIVLMGGQDKLKDNILDQFSSKSGPSILLSSEVGSEGIDLQFSHVIINYDLPWNPMKVEQRIGRVDRLGQKSSKILIWNLFYDETIDSRIYDRLHQRLGIFQYALGGLEPILGDKIQKLTIELLIGNLTPEQEIERIEQTAQAIENIRKDEEDLEQQASHLVAYGDYILNQVKAVRELNRWVTGKDIQVYITDFFKLNYPGCEFIQKNINELVYEIKLTNQAKQDLEEYIKKQRLSIVTNLTRNDPSPIKCRFENKISNITKPLIEVINQVHPIVRFVTNRINNQDEQNYPAISCKICKNDIKENFTAGIYVFTIQHWSIDGLQEIEKLYYSALNILYPDSMLTEEDSELLVTSSAINAVDWLEGRNIVDLNTVITLANEKCLTYSDKKYNEYIQNIQNQNEDRADFQERALDLHLKNQVSKLESVFNKHVQAGRYSLAKATEGKIKAINNRFERKKSEINKRRKIICNKNEICIGIINVIENWSK